MSLDDAIQHLYELFDDETHEWSCEACKQEHAELLSFLLELKYYRTNPDIDEFRPAWINLTDYCPSAYGCGDNPTEPWWRYECPVCHEHVTDVEDPPKVCPVCGVMLRR